MKKDVLDDRRVRILVRGNRIILRERRKNTAAPHKTTPVTFMRALAMTDRARDWN